MDTQERRQELSSFLKQRRDRITPEAVGLPSRTRRRTPGLRREEVAQLAGVGATWYTWLEQGRDIRVSAQVLDSVARVLQLNEVERTYLFELVRDELPPIQGEDAAQVSPTLQLVLDNQQCCPAYVMGWRWDVLAWNHLACLTLIDFETLPEHERNILWLMYLNDEFRSRQPNWQRACQETLAHFRASCAPYIGNPEFTNLIERLKDKSPQFKEHWQQLDVSQKRDSFKEFNHPSLGQLKFEMVMLQVNAFPGIQLVLFVPVADATRQKLKQLEAKGRSA
ncbi:MAG: helix-turn-helix transcriptional regulator [Stenomitos rutilans HA7619-LM2]|jgi:transcriptional regulator with XRE-family HTH domain|nr:helix-turn-helix transcriptional regulator [Stenomitos rutilans HA7619-LM2]